MAEKLNWLRRFLSTAIGFLFWGVAGTLLQLVLYPYARHHQTNSLQTQLKNTPFCRSNLVLFYSLSVFWRRVGSQL